MKDRKSLLVAVFICILIFILAVSLYSIFFPKTSTLGEIHRELYDVMKYDLTSIQGDMEEITEKDDDQIPWGDLKDNSVDDATLKTSYNLLISDIRTCYLSTTDNSDHKITILSLKSKRKVSELELANLNKKESCLKNFDKYNDLTLSTNNRLSEKMKKQIAIIINYKEDSDNKKGFEDLLFKESETVSKISSLSKWLVIEFNSHKK